jgi:hypothetical protein
MSFPRRFAAILLRVAVRQSNDWAVAMRNELDAVEDDWAAMQWAVGCTCVIVKHAATEVLSGVAVAAAVLAVCIGGLSRLVPLHAVTAQWLTSIVLPESVFIVAALALWRRRRSTAMGFALSAVLLVAHVCLWVTASAQTPQPSLETQKLSYFIGTWHADGEMKASMVGPAGKVTNVTRNEWMLNKFFYLTHHEEHNTAGTFQIVSVTGYDPKTKQYVSYEFDGQGGMGRSTGTVNGNTWTWTSQFMVGKDTVRSRSTVKPTSASSYDFTWEIAPHGTDWTLVQQGKATKS